MVKAKYTKKDLEMSWNASSLKRYDTGVPVYNSFDAWYKKYKKK